MLELSERISGYVDTACPTVTVEEVRSRIGHQSHEPAPTAVGRRQHRRVLAFGAAAVVVLAVVLVVQLLPGSGPNTGTEAAAALARMASVAAVRPAGATPGPGQYLYDETSQTLVGSTPRPPGARPFLFEATQTTLTWVAPNGSGRQRIVTSRPRLVAPGQHAAWVAAGSPRPLLSVPGVADTQYPSTRAPDGGPLATAHGEYLLAYLDSTKFPTQPAALQKYMDRYFRIVDNSPSTTFQLAGNVLQVGARPALRAAIFRLIEHLHGVTLLGPTKDATGRTGTGVALDGFGDRYVLVFNPRTSAVLGEKTVSNKQVRHGGEVTPKGTLLGTETFGPTGIASSTSKYPGGRPAPPYLGDTGGGPPNGALFVPAGK